MSAEGDITAVSTKPQVLDVTTILGENLILVITTGKPVGSGVTMTEQIAKELFYRNVRSQVFARRQDTR